MTEELYEPTGFLRPRRCYRDEALQADVHTFQAGSRDCCCATVTVPEAASDSESCFRRRQRRKMFKIQAGKDRLGPLPMI